MKVDDVKVIKGAPLWMATFADMMALLMAFFVLLFASSELEVDKFRQVAGSLRDAFGNAPEDRRAGVIEILGARRTEGGPVVDQQPLDPPAVTAELPPALDPLEAERIEQQAREEREERAAALRGALADAIREEVGGSGVQVDQDGDKVVIRFPNKIAFPSGQGELTETFLATIDKLTPVLRETAGDITVAGHTDNVPISGGQFSSNWELSAARAANVVERITTAGGIAAPRVSIRGYADSRPMAPNDTEEGRARNRRVEISIQVE